MFVYSIVFTYWAPTRCNLHTRYWEQHVFPKHLCLIPVVNSFCCPMSWFLKGWVMPCDALILAREGKLACHDHHQNPSKSLGRHVSVQQEHCQCPGSFQAHRSLCIATVLRIQSAAIFFLATTQCSPRTEKVGILSWRKWYCSFLGPWKTEKQFIWKPLWYFMLLGMGIDGQATILSLLGS